MSVESEFEYEKMQIANMVKRLRAYAALSQRDLSKLTGISQADISKIERGLGNPSINTIARIMNATGASLDFEYNRVNKGATEQIEIWPNLSSHIKLVANNSSNLLVNELGDEIERIILFGSCARGENTDESDIDIAAISPALSSLSATPTICIALVAVFSSKTTYNCIYDTYLSVNRQVLT